MCRSWSQSTLPDCWMVAPLRAQGRRCFWTSTVQEMRFRISSALTLCSKSLALKTTMRPPLENWPTGLEFGRSKNCDWAHSHEEITGGFRECFHFIWCHLIRYLLKLVCVFLGSNIPGFKVERSKKVISDNEMVFFLIILLQNIRWIVPAFSSMPYSTWRFIFWWISQRYLVQSI